MSAAHSIPDVLVSKITLMAYKLSPHPCATMIKDIAPVGYFMYDYRYDTDSTDSDDSDDSDSDDD